MSFAWNDREAWYLPVRRRRASRVSMRPKPWRRCKPILEDPTVAKIGQNLKYDMIVFRAAGIELAGVAFDTMVASYLLEAGGATTISTNWPKRYLNHATIKISELIGTGKDQKRMDEVPTRRVADYAAEDAWLPVRLRPILAKQLAEAELDGCSTSLELPLIDVLAELEYNGIRVDVARLAESEPPLRPTDGARWRRRFTRWRAGR